MKQIAALTIALGLSIAPAIAQEADSEVEEGFNLMEEGAKMLMRGLMSEIEPTIEDLRDTLAEMAPELREFLTVMGPALADMLAEVDDLRNYAVPEFLPNGDIIMRRNPDAPIWVPEGEGDGIDL